MSELLTPYADALLIVSLLMIIVILQSFVGAFFRNAIEKHEAGAVIPADHGSATYRMVRSFENSLENLPLFLPVVFLAIAAAVSPAWVWWVAVLFTVGRLGHWAMYALNIPALRTVFFALGFFSTLALAVKTAMTLI